MGELLAQLLRVAKKPVAHFLEEDSVPLLHSLEENLGPLSRPLKEDLAYRLRFLKEQLGPLLDYFERNTTAFAIFLSRLFKNDVLRQGLWAYKWNLIVCVLFLLLLAVMFVLLQRLQLRVNVTVTKFRIVLPVMLRAPLVASMLALAVAAFGDPPYDFFVLLRLLLFVTSMASLLALYKVRGQSSWLWVLIVVEVLYNPFLPIRLHRETWVWINLATIFVYSLFCIIIRGESTDDLILSTSRGSIPAGPSTRAQP